VSFPGSAFASGAFSPATGATAGFDSANFSGSFDGVGVSRRSAYVRFSFSGAGAGSDVTAGFAPVASKGAIGSMAVSVFAAIASVWGWRTPRPTITPQRKMTTDTTVAAMNMKTSCFPFS
jgi:hypothetical protein